MPDSPYLIHSAKREGGPYTWSEVREIVLQYVAEQGDDVASHDLNVFRIVASSARDRMDIRDFLRPIPLGRRPGM